MRILPNGWLGDIDFIFSKEDYPKAITILRKFGYSEVENLKYYNPETKHYRRLQKENNIAAVEIHKELLIEKDTLMNLITSFVEIKIVRL